MRLLHAKLSLGYEARHSGGLWIYLDHLGILQRVLKLTHRCFSSPLEKWLPQPGLNLRPWAQHSKDAALATEPPLKVRLEWKLLLVMLHKCFNTKLTPRRQASSLILNSERQFPANSHSITRSQTGASSCLNHQSLLQIRLINLTLARLAASSLYTVRYEQHSTLCLTDCMLSSQTMSIKY